MPGVIVFVRRLMSRALRQQTLRFQAHSGAWPRLLSPRCLPLTSQLATRRDHRSNHTACISERRNRRNRPCLLAQRNFPRCRLSRGAPDRPEYFFGPPACAVALAFEGVALGAVAPRARQWTAVQFRASHISLSRCLRNHLRTRACHTAAPRGSRGCLRHCFFHTGFPGQFWHQKGWNEVLQVCRKLKNCGTFVWFFVFPHLHLLIQIKTHQRFFFQFPMGCY